MPKSNQHPLQFNVAPTTWNPSISLFKMMIFLSIMRRKEKGDWYGRQARLADNTCDVIFGAPMAN
jgi:hypothetical protein